MSKQALIPEGLWEALRGGISPSFRYPQLSVCKPATPGWADGEDEALPGCNV